MTLKEYIYSDQNIYLAIYAVHSYVFDYNLLSREDKELLQQLSDPFDKDFIMDTIDKVKNVLLSILETDELFPVEVYFKPKNFQNGKTEFRPIHTSSLIYLIAMVSMLHVLIYEIPDEEKNWQLNLSNFSRMIPNNFYGNRVSKQPEELFKKWSQGYKEYTKKSGEYFWTFNNTGEYRYELKLDLKQFFPSVNPIFLYNKLKEKIPVSLNKDDRKTLGQIILKLLVCKVDNICSQEEYESYYGISDYSGITYTKGIAQGLPQSYFFGNICMIDIASIFNEEFKGKSVYYVDDSYIYTNEVTQESFAEKLEMLNDRIKKHIKKFIKNGANNSFFRTAEYLAFSNAVSNKEQIEVHTGNKSSIFDLNHAKDGEKFLRNLSREASTMGFEINNVFSDEEDVTLLSKAKALVEAIEKELIKEENEPNASYAEKLKRYCKFFKYRLIRLKLKDNPSTPDLILSVLFDNDTVKEEPEKEDYYKLLSALSTERIVKLYKESILQVAIDLSITNNLLSNKQIKDYICYINKLIYHGEMINSSFIKRYYADFIDSDQPCVSYKTNKYKSLKTKLTPVLSRYTILSENAQMSLFTGTRFNHLNESILDSFNALPKDFQKTIIIVDSNSEQMKRMFLNSVYSILFNVTLTDDSLICCFDNSGLTYGVLRMLEKLRNKAFVNTKFFSWNLDLRSFDNRQKIDYNLLEVLEIYRKYIQDPERIDQLICVHKYTSDIWKNGSKHLYFYTLHNQEHAICLIKSIIKLVKVFSYLKISAYDYFLLFVACYLHDISMVKTASKNDFLLDPQSDEITYDITRQWGDGKEFDNNKKCIINSYHKVDAFFENKIRSRHGQDSAEEIRIRKDLNFLSDSDKEFVAEISEGHVQDVKEIYYSKGDAKKKLVSLKFDKILLRLADLLDMSEYRVSKPILNHNLDNISSASAFHWISHLLTSGYSLQSSYSLVDIKDSEQKDFLSPGSIDENIELSVYVKLSQLSSEKCLGCRHMHLVDSKLNSKGFVLQVMDTPKKCNSRNCNFLCKWFNKKNAYMVEEVNAMSQYLNRIPVEERFYNTSIRISVIIQDATKIPDDQFEILKAEVVKE